MTWISGTTETRLGPGGPVIALAYRPTATQRLQLALLVTVVVSAENAIITGARAGFWHGPLIFAVGFTICSVLPMPARTVITPDAVIVRRFVRRSIAWCDVEAIIRKRRFGGATVVLVHEVGGRKTVLPGLVAGVLAWDPAFDSKYETITSWWTAWRAAHGPVHPTA